MGFLKKITRPISRALDKIIPNEVKPALPFLAAAAPFMAPGLMGLGGNTMLSRALMSGGLNIGAQLAQEGSEGEFSGLSALMAAGTGALSAPGTPGTGVGPAGQYGTTGGTPSAGEFFRDKAMGMDPGLTKSGLGALEKSSNYLTGVGETLRNDLFSKEGLKAALVPAGQGMTDLGIAGARRAQKDYERELADYEASIGDSSDMGNRALAIRQSMEAYGFPEDEILAAIEAAGYANGGRVGLKGGGMDYMSTKPSMMGNPAVMENIENMREFMIANPDIEDITDYSEEYKDDSEEVDFKGIEGALEGIDEDEKSEFLKKLIKFRDSVLDVPEMAKGGRIGFKDGTDENLVGIETLKLGDYDLEGFQKKGKGNTLMFGSDDLKILSQALDYGELSDLPARQKEKIKESILRARAGIINPTELNSEINTLRLEPNARAFLKAITPDETVEKVFFDDRTS